MIQRASMRTCPSCRTQYDVDIRVCAACEGVELVDQEAEAAISMSATMRSSAVRDVAVTPAPIVRANTPMSSSGVRARDPSLPDPIIGASLAGRYQVTRKIGEGGMGAVYEARHTLIGKRVAIKVLLDKYVQKADVVARLQQEARLASSIGHENIVDITDFGETDDGRTFVVMEFLEGESLAQLLQRDGPLPPRRAVTIARQIASALGAAHDKGVIHRDVKPENVFICQRGERDFVKVVDFGISKALKPMEDGDGFDASNSPTPSGSPRLTQTGMVLGTPLYMSPEQARGEDDLDHRIDVYALGTILYETLTGETPFQGTNYLSIISQVIASEPRPPGQVRPDLEITPALESVVMKAMAKERTTRYQTMAEVDADLARIEQGGAVKAVIPRTARQKRKLLHIGAWALGLSCIIGTTAIVLPKVLRSAKPIVAEPKIIEVPVIIPAPPTSEPVTEKEKKLQMIKTTITSKPPGAEVWHDDVSHGKTPAMLEFPLSDQQVKLTVRLEGYEEGKATFYPTKDTTLEVTLKKEKPQGKPGSRPKPPGGPVTTSKARDTGPTSGGEIKPTPYNK
jgi:eukaryotic-like serine/threonine-protein kinase